MHLWAVVFPGVHRFSGPFLNDQFPPLSGAHFIPKDIFTVPPHPPALEVVVTDKDDHFNLAKSTCSQSVMKMQSLLYENRMEKVLKKKK